jgi:ubiquinone/menaquinone biosynthesis C-methylase UbiE
VSRRENRIKRADYSRIASFYDEGRSLSGQNIDLWIGLISRFSRAQQGAQVLDLGCGTGRFALQMASRLRFRVTGADSSKEMLAKAKEKDTAGLVKWDGQDAECLTYPEGSFEVVFMSHLLHHVNSPPTVIRECKRILNASGVILIRYGAIDQIRDDVEHKFFPEVLALDKARTPTVQRVEKWLSDAGFSEIISEEIVQRTYDTGRARLNAAKVKSTSVLSIISQEAFEKGIHELAKYVANNPDDPWLLLDKLTLTVGYKDGPT